MKKKYRLGAVPFLLLFVMLLAGCREKTQTKQPASEISTTEKKEITQEEATTGGILTETEAIDEVTLDGMSLDILKNMTVDEKIGQLLFVGLDSLRTDGKTGKLTEISNGLKGKIGAWSPGGIILYSKNIKKQEQTKKMLQDLQEASRIPLFLGTDEEGGEAVRLASVRKMKLEQTEDAETIGRRQDSSKARETGSIIGKYMKDLGFNLNFAPVADVKESDQNAILGKRSYGTDPQQVSEMVKEFVTGIQSENVSSVLKYFPGQGSFLSNTHKGPVDVPKTITELRETEFKPFSAGIEAGADFVMVGHASYSAVAENQTPASLSSLMISEILRNELRFNSVVITDAMNMKAITEVYDGRDAAVKAIEAGNDMILCPDDARDAFDGILQAVHDGKIKEKRLNESVQRILKVKIKRGIIPMDTELIQRNK